MDTSIRPATIPEFEPSSRCFCCFRPLDLCFCADIPTIENRTNVLIVQHRRERFHAFNTARIVHQSLRRCELLVDHLIELAARFDSTPLSKSVGLLYPGDDARLLTGLSSDERPDQLIILDGTWNHARALVRAMPRLQQLPRYRLAPQSPSRYRIRREPNEQALSTLEATVAALRVLEPSTAGLDRLLGVFDQMIDDQLGRTQSNWRRNRRRQRGAKNVPRALLGELSSIVVAYGEQERGDRTGSKPAPRKLPIYWVAERLGTGETFRCAMKTGSISDDDFMACLRLKPEDFRDAVSIETFRERWKAFLRPSERVAVYQPSTARMLSDIDADFAPCLTLKSIQVGPQRISGTLDDVVRTLGIETQPRDDSRAAGRLASAIGIIRYLNSFAALPQNNCD